MVLVAEWVTAVAKIYVYIDVFCIVNDGNSLQLTSALILMNVGGIRTATKLWFCKLTCKINE